MPTTLHALKQAIQALASPMRAQVSQRFFKTGKGQYGEGDVFIGLTVPMQRKLAKQYRDLSIQDTIKLLQSKIHEHRLIALILLVERYERGDEGEKTDVYQLYLKNTAWINNWDLVDSSAQYIVGAHLFEKPIKTQLQLAKSKSLWERRIAMISTFYDIYEGKSDKTISIATLLLHDEHDLIQKAVGWMLREVGKRCSITTLRTFLDAHAHNMPRTALRYAIERMPREEQQHYLNKKASLTNKNKRGFAEAKPPKHQNSSHR